MMTISQLFIYPIKSLGGIEVNRAEVTDRGFKYDRRWMLVDRQHRFMTQREIPQLALLKTSIEQDQLIVTNSIKTGNSIRFPIELSTGNKIRCIVWEDDCEALEAGPEINAWFSQQLNMDCKLVYMPDESLRKVDPDYSIDNEITSFSDAYPFLIIGQSSLDDLNSKLSVPIPMNRFRPNIVFEGGYAFEEDEMEHFVINAINFFGVKPCARCVVTTIDQQKAEKGKEPLKTLSSYREKNNKIYFGQNLLHKGNGLIQRGDELRILKRKSPLF
jgi:uncharacterized protein YcbX